jgi:glycosyltransferase involved in cell wall biosynthesis/D-arabinose 1-dehydrogenase-like Zn-dependent alcohol dehydrogenase
MPETSIVIRSFNEAEYIGDVLEAVEQQEYRDFEVILVDSGSTDGTLEISEEYVDNIEFVAPQNFTFGYSCNVGCKAASGEFVSFLSAHAVPTDDQWLGTMIENLYESDVAMTYSNQVGAEETKFSERRLFNELFPEERKWQTGSDYWANNASSVIKKELWEEHQFDEYLTGHEDIKWAKHFIDRGYAVVYEPDACVYHIHDETWEQVFNRFEREAIADVEIGIKSPSDRWREYLSIPTGILADIIAALREGSINGKTFSNIVRFRYNQHMGTASGLQSERDLEADRFEYFYGGANEKVVIDADGSSSLERSPLPEVRPNEVLVRTDYVGVAPDSIHLDRVDEENSSVVPRGNYVGTVADIGANANTVEVGDVVVGGTMFECGLCSACINGDDRPCMDPVELGVDTDVGAYSRFINVPSDYVYPLPDDIDPLEGSLARTISRVACKIDRATALIPDENGYLVVGDSPRAQIVVQIFEREGRDVHRLTEDERLVDDTDRRDLSAYGLVVDMTGEAHTVERYIQQTGPGTVVLLLGSGYGELTLPDDALKDTTVMKPGDQAFDELDRGFDLLSEINANAILDGTYALEEYETAWQAAEEGRQLPVIKIE